MSFGEGFGLALTVVLLVVFFVGLIKKKSIKSMTNSLLDAIIFVAIIFLVIATFIYIDKSQQKTAVQAAVYNSFKTNADAMDKVIKEQNKAKKETTKVATTQKEEELVIATVTASSSLNIRKGPGKSYGVVKSVKHGAKLVVVDEDSKPWIHVRTNDGAIGYAYNEYLKY